MEEISRDSYKIVNFQVSNNEAGERLDGYLSSRLEISRSHLKQLFDKELILVNDVFEKKSYRLEFNDHIVAQIPPPPQVDLEPREVDFDVVHEEEEWLLINKPPDLSVHPAAGQRMTTLVHGLLHRYPELHDTGEEFRPGIVHRLDRFTSGLLLVAKTNRVHANLTKQFASRDVHKEYFAIVEGLLEYDENIVTEPITRHNKQRERMMCDPSGKPSETLIRVQQRYKKHTAVNCFPKTGRRHQIRVHLTHLGHVILGDGAYGSRIPVTTSTLMGRPAVNGEECLIPRLCLHAKKLQFKDPLTGEPRSFKTDIPKDIQKTIEALESLS